MNPVAIVIPNYNRFATLRGCIESIRSTAGHDDYTIIVVDGGSTDGGREWLDEQDDVTVIDLAERGVPNAVNAGIAAASEDRDVVRVHADVVFETEGWLATLCEAAHSLEKAGVVTGKLVLPDDRIDAAGRNIINGVGIDARHARRRQFQPDGGPGVAVEVDSAPGALFYMRREVIDAVGGFDVSYWPSCLDDDDYCMMARHAGFKVYVHEGVKAIHYTCGFTPTTEGYLPFGGEYVGRIRGLRTTGESVHAEYWAEKWGFHPRRPDLSEIRRLYGETEICWRISDRMRFSATQWPPTVDIAMVTWNNRAVLKRCLDSIAATDYPVDRLHVHIADNGSRDGTVEYLRELKASGDLRFALTVHELPVNTGVAVGMNWAVVKGGGTLVARMDDDVVVPSHWLRSLVEGFRSRPFAGVIGPKILNDNPTHDIQCGPFRMYPGIYAHENEPDRGQADYFARVTHVRGCCNVYRRDTLNDCGLFDLRFSPSQYDDPDHHAALAVSGWEILYDGRVGVIHAMNSGAGKTDAALSNQAANQSKLFGKWGHEIWRTLESSLELSREGKFLPEDGDTSRFTATLENAAGFPRTSRKVLTTAERNRRRDFLDLREKALFGEKAYGAIWEDMMEQARAMRRDGIARAALPLLHSLVDLQPWRWRALHDLALTYHDLGEFDRASLIVDRCRPVAQGIPDIDALARKIAQSRADVLASGHFADAGPVADRSTHIGESELVEADVTVSRSQLRVLMVNTYERRVAGGDMHQVKKTAQYLRRLGVDVTVSYTARPDPTGYDLIHVWNLWFPHQTLSQIKGLKISAPDTPIAMTPIYWDMSEKHWADRVVPRLFEGAGSMPDLTQRLRQLAGDVLMCDGRRRSQAGEPNFPGYEVYQKEILKDVDYLLLNSKLEYENLHAKLGVTKPYTLVYNGAEIDIFDNATPDLFVDHFGIRDFVLCVGLVENRKNQLMLLNAMRDTGIPVVIVGRNYDRRYFRLCEKYGAKNTLFIEHLEHRELASALKAARVFALPSWMECAAFANVEAALAGCSLVVSNRTSEPEYFGDDAYYCDPANSDSIRDAVVKAYRYYEADAPRRARLQRQFREKFTWENAAQQVLTGYEKTILTRRSKSGIVAAPADVMIAARGE